LLISSNQTDGAFLLGCDLGTGPVLVTGSSGWLGRRLIDALTVGLPDVGQLNPPPPGLHVRGLDLVDSKTPATTDRFEFNGGDLRDPAVRARFVDGARGGTLIHTAGVIHPRRVREFYEVNLDCTRELLNAAVSAGVRRAVVVSSNSPCGCNPSKTHRFDESSPYHPYMNYGRSKMMMEQAVNELGRSGKIETVIIRAPWFYGPNQPPRQSLFFRMIRDGKAPIVGDGLNMRSMAYVDNLCQGLIRAASTPKAAGETYWIADERAYSMQEIIDTVERLLETEFGIPCAHKRLRLPSVASEVAWVADKVLQGMGLYHQKIHVLSEMNKTIACTVDKARRELGYQPTVALEEGMRQSLRWMEQDGSMQELRGSR
jgi:nucleoside-diphosphate-sugar epimerase